MVSDIYIDFIGTEAFYNNWGGSASSKLLDLMNWCESTWQQYIEDGSGNYEPNFTRWTQSDVEIPNSAVCGCSGGSCCSLHDRVHDQDDWLSNNWGGYPGSVAIVVADWYGEDQNTYGWASGVGTAGDSTNKTGMVDTWWEDTGNQPSELWRVNAEGVAFHEMSHIFNAAHPAHVTNNSSEEVSLMYSWDGVNCTQNSQFSDVIIQWASGCTQTAVRSYIDNNL